MALPFAGIDGSAVRGAAPEGFGDRVVDGLLVVDEQTDRARSGRSKVRGWGAVAEERRTLPGEYALRFGDARGINRERTEFRFCTFHDGLIVREAMSAAGSSARAPRSGRTGS